MTSIKKVGGCLAEVTIYGMHRKSDILADTAKVINTEYPIQNLFINNDLSRMVKDRKHNVMSLSMG